MSLPYGLHQEQNAAGAGQPHILSFAPARTTADDTLLEVWNGPTSAARVLRLNKDGQLQLQDGAVGAPTIAPEDDKDTGVYFVSGTPEVAVAIAGSKVLSVVAAGVTVTGTLSATGGGSLTGTWSDLGTVTTVDINGGTIDGVTIGASSTGPITAAGITGTVITASNRFVSTSPSNGLRFEPVGGDQDITLLGVGVGGSPFFNWDETNHRFLAINAGFEIRGNAQGGDILIGDAADPIGFYGKTPTSLQSGVAVSSAGIHAALVNLGLITA